MKFCNQDISKTITAMSFKLGQLIDTPTKRSDAQPLVEREKQFECLPVEISRS